MADIIVKQKINASISGKQNLIGSINRNEKMSGNVSIGQVYTQNVGAAGLKATHDNAGNVTITGLGCVDSGNGQVTLT